MRFVIALVAVTLLAGCSKSPTVAEDASAASAVQDAVVAPAQDTTAVDVPDAPSAVDVALDGTPIT